MPSPEAGEVLVEVAASSVNGFDLSTMAGYLQTAMIRSNPTVDTPSNLAGQVASGGLKVPVNSEFDVERAPEAFAASGVGTVGKIAITVA